MMIEITHRLKEGLQQALLEEPPHEPAFDCQVGDLLRRTDRFGHVHVVQSINEEEVISRSHVGNYYVCPREELGVRFTRVDATA